MFRFLISEKKSLSRNCHAQKRLAIHHQICHYRSSCKANGRFVILPTENNDETDIMLLEDVIAFNLPHIFSYFGYDEFKANAFKVTKDAEFDLDNDIRTSYAEKIEKGIKSRRKGKPTRFVFDKDMDKSLVEFLIKKLNLSKKDSIIPGQKIHNFRHFMDFPDVFKNIKNQ
jgi:polyphosphate kinase